MPERGSQPADPFSSAALLDAAPEVLRAALRRGGWFADVFAEASLHHKGRLVRGSALRSAPTAAVCRTAVTGASVRVLTDEAAHLAIAAGPDAAAVRAAGEQAARRVVQTGTAEFTDVQAVTAPVRSGALPLDAPDQISDIEKRALLEAAADAALGLDARVRRVEVVYRDRVRRTLVASSAGDACEHATMEVGLRVVVTLDAPYVLGVATCGGRVGFGHFFAHPPEQLARQAVGQALRLREARPMPSGEMPVVLAAGWGGAWLHEAVGHAMEADVGLEAGEGVRCERIAPPAVTLVDDPQAPGGRVAYACDDEATPAQRTVLIDAGYHVGWLTDRQMAQRYGLATTGHGRRQDYRFAPLPRMTNLALLPGTAGDEALVREAGNGLYVQAFGGGRAYPDGSFVLDIHEGTRIENGRLTHPVVGVRLVGHGLESLRHLIGIGRTTKVETARGLCEKAGQVVPVSVAMPTVLIRSLKVQPIAS